MITIQEYKLIEYLKEQSAVMNSIILVDKDIVEKSISCFLGNGITILSLSFVSLSESGIEKSQNGYVSYINNPVSMDEMMSEINASNAEYTHIEIFFTLIA